MGNRSATRRRQKAKLRAERDRLRERRVGGAAPRREPPRRERRASEAEVLAALWSLAGVHVDVGLDPRRVYELVYDGDPATVARAAEAVIAQAVDAAWTHGWQPAELARHGRRKHAAIGRVVAAAIAADHRRRDRRTLHPDWVAQADEFRLDGLPDRGWLAELAFGGGVAYDKSAPALVVDALRACVQLAALPVLVPPPGSDPATWRSHDESAPVDDPILAKVRALLAQAESTTFPAEAETFTEKAQELMARHAIDVAVLWDRAERSEEPITIRIATDDPYADAKALLLDIVARSSRCRMVMHGDYGLNSVTGFASDVAYTELLYTSLLVQSQSALQAEAAAAPPGSRVRSRSFRSSFLTAYAHRIGDRLARINEHVTATADSDGDRVLPVLSARRDRVDAAVDELFPHLESHRFRAPTDALGFHRGKQAADRAELNPAVAGARRPQRPARQALSPAT